MSPPVRFLQKADEEYRSSLRYPPSIQLFGFQSAGMMAALVSRGDGGATMKAILISRGGDGATGVSSRGPRKP
jgi:hypothetical protein